MSTASDPELRKNRRHVRILARGVLAHLQTADASMPALAVENISLSGIFVRSAAPVRPGTRVLVQLVRVGLKEAVEVDGCVVFVVSPADARARGVTPGMGIRIDPTDAEGARRLRELVVNLAVTERAGADPTTTVAQLADADDDADDEVAPHGTKTDDDVMRDRLIRSLQEEVRALRSENLRRSRTIADMANHIRDLEMAQAAAEAPISLRAPARAYLATWAA